MKRIIAIMALVFLCAGCEVKTASPEQADRFTIVLWDGGVKIGEWRNATDVSFWAFYVSFKDENLTDQRVSGTFVVSAEKK